MGYGEIPRLEISKEKALTLIGSLINRMRDCAKRFGACAISHQMIKGDDPEIDTAPTPKCFDGRLALLEKIRKTFTDSIPNKD